MASIATDKQVRNKLKVLLQYFLQCVSHAAMLSWVKANSNPDLSK